MLPLLIWMYGVGAVGTLAYNLHGMIYVTNPFAILRNAIFWPVFLPVLIALKDK